MNPYSSQLFAIKFLIGYWDPDGGRKECRRPSPQLFLFILWDIYFGFPFPSLLLPFVARPLFLPVPLSSFYSLPLVLSLSYSHGPTDSQINYSNVIFIAEVWVRKEAPGFSRYLILTLSKTIQPWRPWPKLHYLYISLFYCSFLLTVSHSSVSKF